MVFINVQNYYLDQQFFKSVISNKNECLFEQLVQFINSFKLHIEFYPSDDVTSMFLAKRKLRVFKNNNCFENYSVLH